ncbi:TonB-dependent receptor [Echinicola marina]|uniref:TonB-dependent receptor n=1 Tax=Echinicola marina TaxID=2859768 RepID=UPI001CF6DF8E|nr:TonB-dependent receptor [Echinicola marina]UCS91874.1 TonB-dependent receptor [Echinicola marina]
MQLLYDNLFPMFRGSGSGVPKLLKIMKLLMILMLAFQVGVYASTEAQQITLSAKNKSLKEIFNEVTEQSGYAFFYSESDLNESGKVSFSIKNADLEDFLKELLTSKGLDYRLRGETITIVKAENTLVQQSEERTIRGVVKDAKGITIPGANVMEVGTTNGVATDIDGSFSINLITSNPKIRVSFVGYEVTEVAIKEEEFYEIILEEDSEALDEVVVVGFGVQKKESLVSSIATVKGEELRMPTRSLSNNLAGQVPGLIAVQRSGEPGYDNAEFWIRGISSFAGGTSPLVLVDGVPRNMNDIEPDEIETFTLLKDAAATAIYGAEGANGVVIITSKRGKNQKTQISYRGEYSVLQPTRLPEFLGSADYMSLYNEALLNEGKQPVFSEDLIARYKSGQDPDLYPDVNWLDLLSNTTNNTRHTLNFRGGGEKARFFISGAYFSESGIFESNPVAEYDNNIGLKRYNLRSNVDFDVTKTTKLMVDLSGQYLETSYPGVGTSTIFQRMTIAPPHLFPMIFSDGSHASHPVPSGNRVNPYNLLMESGYAKEWRSSIQSKVAIEQDISVLTEGLKVRGVISYDANFNFNMNRTKTPAQYIAAGRDINGDLIFNQTINESPFGEPSESNSGNKNIYLETSINYNRTFDEKHAVGGMFLYYQKEQQLHNQALAFRKQAYIGRGTYTYDRRYSLEANFGLTGSETFAEGYRYGFFPAVGVSWIVENEQFMNNLKHVISGLKVRGSIGRTGNDNTGGERFLYRGTFTGGSGYPIGIGGSGALNGMGGYVEGRFAAPSLSWEIENKRNVGLELGLFEDRITFQADYFDNFRYNILLQRRTVSAATGFRQAPWQNYGKVSNKGIDASFNARKYFGEVLVSLRGNFTYAKNKIIEYDEIEQLYPWMNVTGTSLNTPNLYVAEGLYTYDDFDVTVENGTEVYTLKEGLPVSSLSSNNMPGDIRYKDLNGDGVINQFDQSRGLASPSVPEMIYGAGVNVEYKNFYINMFFQGAGKVSTVLGASNGQGFFPFSWGVDESSVRVDALNRWTQENPSQDVMFPRLRTSSYWHNRAESTWWLRDASFVRLKNAEIGYRFKKSLLQKIGVTTGRVYLMGNNIYVWDKIKMWDPEMGNANAGMNYPLPRTFTFGLEFTL